MLATLFLSIDLFATHSLHYFFFSYGFAWSFQNYILYLKVLIFHFFCLVDCSDLSFKFKPMFAFMFWLFGLSLFLWKIIFCKLMIVDDITIYARDPSLKIYDLGFNCLPNCFFFSWLFFLIFFCHKLLLAAKWWMQYTNNKS